MCTQSIIGENKRDKKQKMPKILQIVVDHE